MILVQAYSEYRESLEYSLPNFFSTLAFKNQRHIQNEIKYL